MGMRFHPNPLAIKQCKPQNLNGQVPVLLTMEHEQQRINVGFFDSLVKKTADNAFWSFGKLTKVSAI